MRGALARNPQLPAPVLEGVPPRLLLAVLMLLPLAGCTGEQGTGGCPDLPLTTQVERVQGTDIVVDGGELVLHAASSRVFLRSGDSCTQVEPGALRAGDRLGHDAQAIAHSYPAQAWPETILAQRP